MDLLNYSMTYILKLSEATVGDRMLVACLYRKLPCGHTEEYEEWMMAVLEDPDIDFFSKKYDGLEWTEHVSRPMTEGEKADAERSKRRYATYRGKSLLIGGREYPIYDANRDFMPCGNAPEIELTAEEVEAWRQEFRGKDFGDSPWVPFFDEVFLK